jgi:hypothetical protein
VNANIVVLLCSFLCDAIHSGKSNKVSEILFSAFRLHSVLKSKAVVLPETVTHICRPASLYILQDSKSAVSFDATNAVRITKCI